MGIFRRLILLTVAAAIIPLVGYSAPQVIDNVAPADSLAAGANKINQNFLPLGNVIWMSAQGATLDGVTNGYTLFNSTITEAAVTGKAIVIDGPLAIGTSVTVPSNVGLIILGAGKIVPAASVLVTINGPLWAPAKQIFDVAAASSRITGTVKPMGTGNRVLTEWFGAIVDDSTDDATAVQAAARLARDAGYIGIQLLSGTYNINTQIFADGTDSQSTNAPSWYGTGRFQTILRSTGLSAGQGILRFRGGSGTLTGAVVQDMTFVGESLAANAGVVFSGKCGMKVINSNFDSLAEGVRFWNEESSSFAEFDEVVGGRFRNSVVAPIKYVKGSGSGSFHGSGVTGNAVFQSNGGSIVTIGTGSQVYNAPFDATVFVDTGAVTVFENQSSLAATFVGQLKGEAPSGTPTLASGTVRFAGPYSFNNETWLAGTLIQTRANQYNSDTSTQYEGMVARGSTLIPSAPTTITPSGFSVVAREAYIRFKASNFDYRYFLILDSDETGGAGFIGTIATLRNLNTAGYGAPTLTVSTSGNFTVTPPTQALTFTGTFAGGETSGTLNANWATRPSGVFNVTFSNADVRAVTFTNGATTATWTGGLSGAATASATANGWPTTGMTAYWEFNQVGPRNVTGFWPKY